MMKIRRTACPSRARAAAPRANRAPARPRVSARRHRRTPGVAAGLACRPVSLAASFWPRDWRSERDGIWLNRHRALGFLFEHDLFGKPLHTFPDHALVLLRREAFVLDDVGPFLRLGLDIGP